MAKQKHLTTLLQRALPRLSSDIDHRMRALRQGDQSVLPQGGRGRHAPELRPVDAAYMMIGALSLERPKDGKVVEETIRMASMKRQEVIVDGVSESEREKKDGTGLKGYETFVEALAGAFADGYYLDVRWIKFFPMSRGAIICTQSKNRDEDGLYSDGRKYYFGALETETESVGVSFEISALLLFQIGLLLGRLSEKFAKSEGLE